MSLRETLPAAWYVDEAIHCRERAAIFARNCCLFGPEAELASAGGYRAAVISGWPVFIIRGHDASLRGFHNVGRHRAAQLLANGTGNCNILRCPYHCWSYDLEGRLKATPSFGDDAVSITPTTASSRCGSRPGTAWSSSASRRTPTT